MKRTIIIFCALLLFQLGFWWRTHTIVPDMSIVPNVPGKEAVKVLSMGDEQAFFRLLALNIQNFGDTFGRFTALKKYDFNKLSRWFALLDSLDNTSNYIPAMATYYFSQTQNKPDVRYIVDYLIAHTKGRAETKWWWNVQAIYLATHMLHDKDLALEVAKPLEDAKNVPVWVKQMPAFVYEQRGEMDSALQIIQDILKHEKSLSQGELNFMRYFAEERLHKLEQVEGELEQAEKKVKPAPNDPVSTIPKKTLTPQSLPVETAPHAH